MTLIERAEAARKALAAVWVALGDMGDDLEEDRSRFGQARRRSLELLQDNLLRAQGEADALVGLLKEP